MTFAAQRNQHVQMKPVVDKNNVIRKEKVFVAARTQTKILMDALIVLNVVSIKITIFFALFTVFLSMG